MTTINSIRFFGNRYLDLNKPSANFTFKSGSADTPDTFKSTGIKKSPQLTEFLNNLDELTNPNKNLLRLVTCQSRDNLLTQMNSVPPDKKAEAVIGILGKIQPNIKEDKAEAETINQICSNVANALPNIPSKDWNKLIPVILKSRDRADIKGANSVCHKITDKIFFVKPEEIKDCYLPDTVGLILGGILTDDSTETASWAIIALEHIFKNRIKTNYDPSEDINKLEKSIKSKEEKIKANLKQRSNLN